jgi:hypothetical protein
MPEETKDQATGPVPNQDSGPPQAQPPAQPQAPAPTAAEEPLLSLTVFLEGGSVLQNAATLLTALYADRKLPRAGWVALAEREMKREVR